MARTKIFGEHQKRALEQFEDVASRADRAALMADGQPGYTMPVGGVTAYRDQVSIAGVGVDIACGNAAAKTNLHVLDLEDGALEDIADDIWNTISFGAGKANPAEDAPGKDITDAAWENLFLDDRWNLLPASQETRLWQKARKQLGTIGGGNHYVDVFADEDGWVWVGVHFGSRGFGYEVSTAYLNFAAGNPWKTRWVRGEEGLVHLENPVGHDYWHLMELAGDYAYAGREWVVRKVVRDILGGEIVDLVHNNHNYAWREEHEGQEFVVVRKGATPAFPGQRGFVGGSMGDNAVILEGAEHEDNTRESWLQKQALFSTVHGAGRPFSRSQAKREIDPQDMQEWVEDMGVIVRGAGLDEAPQAYRRLGEVLEAQGDTINVLHTLRPLVVCMADD